MSDDSNRTPGLPEPPPQQPNPERGQPDNALRGDRSPRRLHPELEYKEVRTGSHPGERFVRVVRPRTFRRSGQGTLTATTEVLEPRGGAARWLDSIKHLLIGQPLASADLIHERLSKVKALAVFSSDALSSVAYATEEILLVLVVAGTGALRLSLPIALAIAVLLIMVVWSYRQTIRSYPLGGGDYIVAKDNLGNGPALVAGGALLIDYTLTVAVSISAGVAALTSAFPVLYDQRVLLAVAFIIVMTVLNLRGVRESGNIFAVPTYFFVISILGLIAVGVLRALTGGFAAVVAAPLPPVAMESMEPLTILLLLRAFAAGCTALTGTEAIADGVPAFEPPEAQNASTTLAWMAVLMTVMFLGVTFLAYQMGIAPRHDETVLSQIARNVFGDSPLYFVMQAATTLILILAANTAFADFPRLSYFLARDHFLPHQFSFRGDRLAFSTGIMALGFLASVMVIFYNASTHSLIPLYAVGVFVSFTISQASMVWRWWTRREPGWQRGMVIQGLGAATTGTVALVIGSSKFLDGAWMVMLLIPGLVFMFHTIARHYRTVREQLTLEPGRARLQRYERQVVLVPVSDLNRATVQALSFARSISEDATAIHVADDLEAGEALRREWNETIGNEVRLVILESPYRALVPTLLAYIDEIDDQEPGIPVTVVLPEYIPAYWWQHLLHNQSALRLKAALLFRPDTVVVDFPLHLER